MKLPERIVFATNNAHKLQEARAIFKVLTAAGNCGCEILSLDDIGCHDDIEETAETLEGNALIKARWINSKYGLDCFADDTGLEVKALGGAPGVMSARYAAIDNPDAQSHDSKANMRLLLKNMQGKSDRSARFRTAIALILNNKEYMFEGVVKGNIAAEPAGKDGFGYDPVFVPEGHTESFAQMSAEKKNSMSHRGQALASLIEFLSEEKSK